MAECIYVNIWDDYDDAAGAECETYAYVEARLPDLVCRDVLFQLEARLELLKDPASPFSWELVFYDSATKYPELVGTRDEWCLYKRWELRFKGLTHRERERIVELLDGCGFTFDGTPVVVISES